MCEVVDGEDGEEEGAEEEEKREAGDAQGEDTAEERDGVGGD